MQKWNLVFQAPFFYWGFRDGSKKWRHFSGSFFLWKISRWFQKNHWIALYNSADKSGANREMNTQYEYKADWRRKSAKMCLITDFVWREVFTLENSTGRSALQCIHKWTWIANYRSRYDDVSMRKKTLLGVMCIHIDIVYVSSMRRHSYSHRPTNTLWHKHKPEHHWLIFKFMLQSWTSWLSPSVVSLLSLLRKPHFLANTQIHESFERCVPSQIITFVMVLCLLGGWFRLGSLGELTVSQC